MQLQRTITTPHPAVTGSVAAGWTQGPPQKPAASEVKAGTQARARPSFGHTQTYSYFAPESDWFMDLFGFREVQYEDTQKRLKIRPDRHTPSSWVLEGENGATYKVGRFSTPKLSDLSAQATSKGGLAALPGKLKVRNVRGDVSAMLGEPRNRHATFQVASQFNCLEYLSPSMRPEHGVTMYVKDRTQGPACSVACGPATVYRNYFAEVGGGVGQRYNRQLNNLQDLSERVGNGPDVPFFRVDSGYTLASDKGLRALNSRLDGLRDAEVLALRRELRVGVHEDVQVTSMEWGTCPVEDEEQTVTQVFGSACSVSYSGNDPELWEPFARLVLSASYEATLYAALLSALRHRGRDGSKRVFLTCLGGGIFGNETRWISDAMHEALSKFRDCGLEVNIVTYGGPYPRELLKLEKAFEGA